MIKDYASRYARWTRAQGSALNCGHVVLAGLALAVIGAACAVALVQRYHVVIVQGLEVAAAMTVTGLAAWVALRRWHRGPSCAGCGTSAGVGEVTHPDGLRSGTALLCGPCWDIASAQASCPAGPAWPVLDPGAEAAALRGELTAAPDNEPAEDEHTAAELARVLEQAGP